MLQGSTNQLEHNPIIESRQNAIEKMKRVLQAGNSLDISAYDKWEGMNIVRDAMATLLYSMLEEHSGVFP